MSRLMMPPKWGAAFLLGVLLANPVLGQTIRPAASARKTNRGTINQMEIYDGARRTVRYFGENISPGESATLREMERLENEVNYLDDLQSLKRQYVVSERQLEIIRRLVQKRNYGIDTTYTGYDTSYLTYGNGYGFGYGMGGSYYYPYVYPGRTLNNNVLVGGDSYTVTHSLASGVGLEGRIKDAMAAVLAQQATPEYAANIDRSLDRVALRASTSPTLRVALGLPTLEQTRKEQSTVRLASTELPSSGGIIMILKDGEKLAGTKLDEKGDWFLLEKTDGSKLRIRQSEVNRIEIPRTTGISPAVDEK